jgi:tryptophanyl-tRNA synthetase
LTREIVRRFNGLYKEIFPEPKPLLTSVPRLLGLDGRKMSKSYGNFIGLSDVGDVLRKKVGGMFTDPKRIRKSDPGHPETCNVHSYFEVFVPEMKEEVEIWCREAMVGCTECKKILAEKLEAFLAPIQEKRSDILGEPKKLEQLIVAGREKARAIAHLTTEETRSVIGLTPCPTK